jgi:predicted ATPase with chaperone activity
MLAKVLSSAVLGVDAYLVAVEVDIALGLPTFNTVGLPDVAVKESRDRVKAAIKNSGFDFPAKRITVNLAPADIKKEGAASAVSGGGWTSATWSKQVSVAKREALEVAAAGGHNILIAAGVRQDDAVRRLPTILPTLSLEEAISTTKIHSICGLLSSGQALLATRPFRAPHHTISDAGLIGGGNIPRPGEVSLAHHGVLFLDSCAFALGPRCPAQPLERAGST